MPLASRRLGTGPIHPASAACPSTHYERSTNCQQQPVPSETSKVFVPQRHSRSATVYKGNLCDPTQLVTRISGSFAATSDPTRWRAHALLAQSPSKAPHHLLILVSVNQDSGVDRNTIKSDSRTIMGWFGQVLISGPSGSRSPSPVGTFGQHGLGDAIFEIWTKNHHQRQRQVPCDEQPATVTVPELTAQHHGCGTTD